MNMLLDPPAPKGQRTDLKEKLAEYEDRIFKTDNSDRVRGLLWRKGLIEKQLSALIQSAQESAAEQTGEWPSESTE